MAISGLLGVVGGCDPAYLVTEAERGLRARYGSPHLHNQADPIDELVFILLSSRTPEKRYLNTYRQLRRRYNDWEQVLNAPTEELEEALRPLGLAQRKAHDLKEILGHIAARFGRLSLEALRELSDAEAQDVLTSLPGVGLKSARCVMLFSLARMVLPVDTHVWRVFKRLGLARGGRVPTEQDANRLQSLVEVDLRYSVHVNAVAHGRDLCRETNPRCSSCPILYLCPFGCRGSNEPSRACP